MPLVRTLLLATILSILTPLAQAAEREARIAAEQSQEIGEQFVVPRENPAAVGSPPPDAFSLPGQGGE